MNDLQLKDEWHLVKDKVKNHWPLLTDGDLKIINGEYNTLKRILSKKYNKPDEETEKDIGFFLLEQKSNPQQ